MCSLQKIACNEYPVLLCIIRKQTLALPEYDDKMVAAQIAKFQCRFTVAEVTELYISERAIEIVKSLGRDSMQRHLLASLGTSVLRPSVCDATGFHPRNPVYSNITLTR